VQAEMKTVIIEISRDLAEKFVSVSIDKDIQSKLYEETMSQIKELSWRS